VSGTVLETRDLTVRFGGHVAVDGVSCLFRPGQLCAIVGPNGAGKTTFFNAISGQVRNATGAVMLDGRDVSRLSASARTRMGLGRAFQLTNLFPGLTVFENLRLVVQRRLRRRARMFVPADRDRAVWRETEAVLSRVGLESRARLHASELSHGDQRRLEVGMLLALDPGVYMFDEPTAGMSLGETPAVLDLVRELKRDATRVILLVEHKLDVVRALADRVVVLHNGRVVADGAPGVVMQSAEVRDIYLGRAPASA
jgi:branched-chain amino acid transport system ATP-binding protein